MASQTGSIDLTASNSVKLAAEAGWQSELQENYYTSAEIDLTVSGINSTVSTKVGEDEVISSINQSSESVSINANKINLTGAVTISDLSSDAQSATLNSNISVGGRNWLLDTGTFDNWYRSSVVTASDGITTFPSRSSLSWICTRCLTIPAEDFFGDTWTFSFDYRSDDFSSTSGNRYIDVNLEAGATYNASNRTKYRALNSSSVSGAANTWVPTTEWQRGSVTFTAADESFLSNGSGDVNYVGITIWSYTLNSFQVRHMKLERGNKATDWTPAPEDVDGAISDAAKTATNYVTDITGGGVMVHPSDDATSGVWITSNVDIMRGGTSVINIGTNDAVRIGAAGNVQMLLAPDGMEIDNESGATIFEVDTTGGEARTREKELHTWDTAASVTMTAYVVRDDEVADGDVTVTVGVNGTYYTLDSTYADVAITPGTSVSVNLTQSGVSYVRDLMVELDDDGNVIETYPCTLFAEYTLATTVRAKLSFTGDQVVDGVGGALVAENTVWSSDNKTDVFLVARNAETGAGVRLGVGAGGHNRGVYDHVKKDWVIYRNADNKTVINGPNFSVAASGATKCGLAGNFARTSVTILNSQSMAVDGYQQGTTSLTKAGWKPIGIAGWHSNSRYATTVRAYISGASSGSGTLNWEVFNVRSSSITATVIIYVLWARV